MISWDDDIFILDNPVIQELNAENLKSIFTESQFGLMAPILSLSLAADYHFFQDAAWGYRLHNLMLHAFNIFLVFFIFRFFIKQEGDKTIKCLLIAILVAIIWGIHPLRIESTIWISQRRDVLSGFFCLLSLAFYLSAAKSKEGEFLNHNEKGYSTSKRWISVFFFILAVASKPSVVAFPVVLILLDLYPFKKFEIDGKLFSNLLNSVFSKIEYFIVSVSFAILTIVAHKDQLTGHTKMHH